MSTASETPIPANEHELTRERVGAVAGWLVEGKLRPNCVVEAMEQWHVSRRMAQVYVARAAARIVKTTTFEDPRFALKLSQIQRDKLHLELQELLRGNGLIEHSNWQLRLKTIQADMKLLDSRDRTAAKLLQIDEKNSLTEERRTQQRLRKEARAARETLRTSCHCLPANPDQDSASKATSAGKQCDPGLTEALARPGRETLRPETPPALPPASSETSEKTKPQPRSNATSRRFMAEIQTALLGKPVQPSAGIAIVPESSKPKASKAIGRQECAKSPIAPDDISCALETHPVANRHEEVGPG